MNIHIFTHLLSCFFIQDTKYKKAPGVRAGKIDYLVMGGWGYSESVVSTANICFKLAEFGLLRQSTLKLS